MKKLILTLLVLTLTLSLSLPALAQSTSPGDNRLVVNGSGNVSLKADQATLEVGAQTRSQDVGQAHKANVAIMEKVIAELAKLGITKEDIRTSQYNVYLENFGMADSSSAGGFVINNMVYIVIKDINQVSTVIDTVTKAGANNIYNLTFQATKANEAYQQALNLAVEDAKTKAALLAQAIGRPLGDILTAQATPSYIAPFAMYDRAAVGGEESSKTPVFSGDVSISAEVTLVFQLD